MTNDEWQMQSFRSLSFVITSFVIRASQTVYHFRPFRNSDPPRLAEIWRNQPPQRGVMQPVSAGLLEQFVFSKPYFDPDGLIVATHDGAAVGFVHAGFGPNDEETALSTDLGTTYVLMLRGDHRHAALADELLARAEGYLRDRGTRVLYAGGVRPLNGFYLGLYGGSELTGVLASDPVLGDTCPRNHYREIDRVVVLQRELRRYRQPITRSQRQLRRETTCREEYCPPAKTWWEACTSGAFERLQFTLEPTSADGGGPWASVWFWDIEPLSTGWGVPTTGMYDLHVASARRRRGVATYLLSEAFARLSSRGIVLVEAQTMQTNAPALALYQKLGFEKVDEGVVYRKE
jgi:ribosomal protein S18 acetylase RimI-like enzyme